MLRSALICAALAVTTPAMAQVPNPDPARELPQDRGYDVDTPKHRAVDAQEQPVTQALNAQAGAAASAASAQADAVNTADADAEAQAHYQADLDSYRAAVDAHARTAMRDQDRFARQQHAYAEAMRAWRMQTYACEKGHLKACKLPTPNPADYY